MEKKTKATKPIKNQALFKKGGYSIAITAIVLVGIIVLNILVAALSSRFVLEIDMTEEKINSISKENLDYIRDVDEEVSVIMCSTETDYVEGYMSYYAQEYGIADAANAYYKQTVALMKKYANYNKNIKVQFADTQDSSFAEITTKYANENLNYGDIIVSAKVNGVERYKILTFTDIYEVTEDESYAAYGYSYSTVTGNQIETSLTSAIAYVLSNNDKKIALLTGHSVHDYTAGYKQMLEDNNYTVDTISDSIITEISDEYDAIVIASPANDFLKQELDIIAAFLDNNGKLNKGLIYFADASLPYLPNLADFLEQWGIYVDEGVLYETEEGYAIPDDPTTLFSAAASEDSLTSNITYCLTGHNVPITGESSEEIEVTTLISSYPTTVIAPAGVESGWSPASSQKKQSYSTVIQAVKEDYVDNTTVSSYVMAFSSIQFIYSEYAEMDYISNKNIVLAASERASRADYTGIYFVSKSISEKESFASKVTAADANIILIIFVVLLPLACIGLCIYIYIKRRNA